MKAFGSDPLNSHLGLASSQLCGYGQSLCLSHYCVNGENSVPLTVRTKWGGEKHTNILSLQLECSGRSVHPQSGKVLETTCREMVKAVTPRAVQLQSPGSELLTILPRSSFYG